MQCIPLGIYLLCLVKDYGEYSGLMRMIMQCNFQM
jgi:hypothetical protein